jgi:hypothetical protein
MKDAATNLADTHPADTNASRRRLFGREAELAAVVRLLDGVARSGSAIVVSGSAGIGKSTLLEEVADEAGRRGFVVLTAAGIEPESGLPFAGLHQLLRPVLDGAVRLPPRQRRALETAFGGSEDAQAEQFIVALAALNLLADVATSKPVLLIVEQPDVLDEPSIDALLFIARRLA